MEFDIFANENITIFANENSTFFANENITIFANENWRSMFNEKLTFLQLQMTILYVLRKTMVFTFSDFCQHQRPIGQPQLNLCLCCSRMSK